MASKRIMKEYASIVDKPVEDVDVEDITDDIFSWTASIHGPKCTPYEGAKFKVKVELGHDYPFKGPKVVFETMIYHMNISSNGNVCLGHLKPENWKPSTKICEILQGLVQLLMEPELSDPIVPEIAELYRTNREEHDRKARESALKAIDEERKRSGAVDDRKMSDN